MSGVTSTHYVSPSGDGWPLIAAAAFIGGDVFRWRSTPQAMLTIHGGMAAMCAYETFFLLTNESRFRARAIECTEYDRRRLRGASSGGCFGRRDRRGHHIHVTHLNRAAQPEADRGGHVLYWSDGLREGGNVAKKTEKRKSASKKHVGDVIGVSRARVPKDVPRATRDRGGRPKGIELPPLTKRGTGLKPSRTVGGVRGRGR
jgi:hypothetical protein